MPLMPYDNENGDDDLPDSKWLLIPKVVQFPNLFPQLAAPEVSPEQKEELKRIHKEVLMGILSDKPLGGKKIGEFAKEIEQVVPIEQARSIWKGSVVSSIKSSRFPGFYFTSPVTAEVLGLSHESVQRLKAFQFDTRKRILKLRQRLVELQNQSFKSAIKSLDMEQRTRISQCTNNEFDWKVFLQPKWVR